MAYPMRHHPYGHEPSSSSSFSHDPFRYDGEPSRTCQQEMLTLMKGQAELRELVKDLVSRVEKLEEKIEEKLDEKSESTSSSHKLPPELSVCYCYYNILTAKTATILAA